jgi:hypothetical protein
MLPTVTWPAAYPLMAAIALMIQNWRATLRELIEARLRAAEWRQKYEESGRQVHRRGDNLKPSSKQMLALGFSAGLFKSHDYLLTLEGMTAQGRVVQVARYSFRILNQ